jgi:hypothetical protein
MKTVCIRYLIPFIVLISIISTSIVSAQSKIPKPESNIKNGTYLEDKILVLSCKDKKAKIFYTVDGTEPSEKSEVYDVPMVLQKTAILKAAAIKKRKKSETLVVDYTRLKNISSIVLTNKPSEKYPVDNIYSVFDNKPASENYLDHSWLAFEGNDFESVVTFDKMVSVSEMSIVTLQKTDANVYFPAQLEYYVSPDGKNFIKAGIVLGDDAESKENFKIVNFIIPSREAVVKAIKLVAKNKGFCPNSDEKAWLFINKVTFK